MPDTTNLALPYPGLTDGPNGPAQIQALAQAIDAPLGPWGATWNPVWQQADGTNLSVGNGVMTGRYTVVGKTCIARLSLTRGSTTNVGSGNYQWLLPLPALGVISIGSGLVRVAATGVDITCIARLITGSLLVMTRTDSFARIGSANPVGVSGDIYQWAITYETS